MFLEAELPSGMRTTSRVAALGDVHGRQDALRIALESIQSPEETEVVLLGDYVNRGPMSGKVLDHLRDLEDDHPFANLVLLPGNHDHMLLEAARDPMGAAASDWAYNENHLTIMKEYPAWDTRSAMRDLAERLPKQVIRRFNGELPQWHKNGDLLFIHAGVHPWALPHQMYPKRPEYPSLATWVREDFLYHKLGHSGPDGEPVIVVHGHTRLPANEIEMCLDMSLRNLTNNHRIGLDVSHTPGMLLMEAEGAHLRVRSVSPADPSLRMGV